MKIKYLTLMFSLLFGLIISVYAQEDGGPSQISAYRSYVDIVTSSILVPTVIEVPLKSDFIERSDFAIHDRVANSFEPYYFKQRTSVRETPLSVDTTPLIKDPKKHT